MYEQAAIFTRWTQFEHAGNPRSHLSLGKEYQHGDKSRSELRTAGESTFAVDMDDMIAAVEVRVSPVRAWAA